MKFWKLEWQFFEAMCRSDFLKPGRTAASPNVHFKFELGSQPRPPNTELSVGRDQESILCEWSRGNRCTARKGEDLQDVFIITYGVQRPQDDR